MQKKVLNMLIYTWANVSVSLQNCSKKISKIKRVGTHVPVPGTLRELSEIGFRPNAKSMSARDYTRALWSILTC